MIFRVILIHYRVHRNDKKTEEHCVNAAHRPHLFSASNTNGFVVTLVVTVYLSIAPFLCFSFRRRY